MAEWRKHSCAVEIPALQLVCCGLAQGVGDTVCVVGGVVGGTRPGSSGPLLGCEPGQNLIPSKHLFQ